MLSNSNKRIICLCTSAQMVFQNGGCFKESISMKKKSRFSLPSLFTSPLLHDNGVGKAKHSDEELRWNISRVEPITSNDRLPLNYLNTLLLMLGI